MDHGDKGLPAGGELAVGEIHDSGKVSPKHHAQIIDAVDDAGIGHGAQNDNQHHADAGNGKRIQAMFADHPDIVADHPLDHQHAEKGKDAQSHKAGRRRDLEEKVMQAARNAGKVHIVSVGGKITCGIAVGFGRDVIAADTESGVVFNQLNARLPEEIPAAKLGSEILALECDIACGNGGSGGGIGDLFDRFVERFGKRGLEDEVRKNIQCALRIFRCLHMHSM